MSEPGTVSASGLFGYSFCRGPSKTLPPSIFWPRRLPALPEMPQSFSKLVVIRLELGVGDAGNPAIVISAGMAFLP